MRHLPEKIPLGLFGSAFLLSLYRHHLNNKARAGTRARARLYKKSPNTTLERISCVAFEIRDKASVGAARFSDGAWQSVTNAISTSAWPRERAPDRLSDGIESAFSLLRRCVSVPNRARIAPFESHQRAIGAKRERAFGVCSSTSHSGHGGKRYRCFDLSFRIHCGLGECGLRSGRGISRSDRYGFVRAFGDRCRRSPARVGGIPLKLFWDVADPALAKATSICFRLSGHARSDRTAHRRSTHQGFISSITDARRRMDSILDLLDDGIVAHDASRRIWVFNRAAERLPAIAAKRSRARLPRSVPAGRYLPFPMRV